MNAEERRVAVLRAIVADFVATNEPVGSKALVDRHNLGVSSATVRNDMAALEEEGYIAQPHTSAGRIPTEKGYRFFVDNLGQPANLRRNDAVQVRSFFEQAHGELEQMLQDTSRLLGDLTTYAGVVVGPTPSEATVRSVQVVGITPTTAPFDSTVTTSAVVGVMPTTCTERTVASDGVGPTTTPA